MRYGVSAASQLRLQPRTALPELWSSVKSTAASVRIMQHHHPTRRTVNRPRRWPIEISIRLAVHRCTRLQTIFSAARPHLRRHHTPIAVQYDCRNIQRVSGSDATGRAYTSYRHQQRLGRRDDLYLAPHDCNNTGTILSSPQSRPSALAVLRDSGIPEYEIRRVTQGTGRNQRRNRAGGERRSTFDHTTAPSQLQVKYSDR